MEKQKRTYDLESLKDAFHDVESLGGRVTNSAFREAQELGLSREDMIEVIQALETRDFYKSMTSYANHRVWQDVYHSEHGDRELYLKFSVKANGDYLLISFKEK